MSTHPASNGGLTKAAGITGSLSVSLPVIRGLTLAYASSLIIALLMAITSVAGLLRGPNLYPTEEMLLFNLPTDLITLVVGLPILFSLMNLAQIITALISPTPDYLLAYPVWIADFAVVAPAWLIGGWLLWQCKALGYVAGAGLLLVGSMLFVGVIFALTFPAVYTASPVDVTGILFILVMGLICFVPLALLARGIVKSDRSSHRVTANEAEKGKERT